MAKAPPVSTAQYALILPLSRAKARTGALGVERYPDLKMANEGSLLIWAICEQ